MIFNNKNEIINWLHQMGIDNYYIHDDLSVDVNDFVWLDKKQLTELPVQFGVVKDGFSICQNQLISLKGCPREVPFFDCSYNQLTSLDFSPTKVNEYFCTYNPLEYADVSQFQISNRLVLSHNRLKHVVLGAFNAELHLGYNRLEHLGLMPTELFGSLSLDHNPLVSLIGLPRIIHGSLNISHTKIESLEGVSQIIEQEFACCMTKLNHLNIQDLPQQVGYFYMRNNGTGLIRHISERYPTVSSLITEEKKQADWLDVPYEVLQVQLFKEHLENNLEQKAVNQKRKI